MAAKTQIKLKLIKLIELKFCKSVKNHNVLSFITNIILNICNINNIYIIKYTYEFIILIYHTTIVLIII